MIVTIQTATELTGKSRATISRYIKNGKLSRSEKGIDTSELIRVFGALKNPIESSKSHQSTNAMSDRELWLMNQIESLQRDIKELKTESLTRENRLMALLENQATKQTEPKPDNTRGGGLFSKLFK